MADKPKAEPRTGPLECVVRRLQDAAVRAGQGMTDVRGSDLKEVLFELAEGDYWQERARRFMENGGCPECFASDETEHTDKCEFFAACQSIVKIADELKQERGMVEVLQHDLCHAKEREALLLSMRKAEMVCQVCGKDWSAEAPGPCKCEEHDLDALRSRLGALERALRSAIAQAEDDDADGIDVDALRVALGECV